MAESRRRRWLATAVVEAGLVVFAVLVALAVDEWWEARENGELADRTTEAIAAEIRRNRAELLGGESGPGRAEMIAGLDSAIAAYRAEREPQDVAVNWQFALLSSAAWETAQLTRTTRYMDLQEVMEVAEVYELQRFFSRNQDELASLISDMGGRMDTEPVAALGQVRSRMALTLDLRDTLTTVYACTLVYLEGPEVAEAEDCPGGGAAPDRTGAPGGDGGG